MPELLKSSEIKAPLSYDTSFDVHAYHNLFAEEGKVPPQQLADKLLSLNREIRTNLEADLAERFNVEFHRAEFRIVNGKIYHPSFDEPFLETMRRGLIHRHKLSNSHDFQREAAEIESFSEMENRLASEDLRIVIMSPPGGINSIYQHSFVDVLEKSKHDKGILTLRRVTIKSSIDEYLKAADSLLGHELVSDLPKDIALKKTAIATTKSMEEIVSMFNPAEETMTYSQFQKLKGFCSPAISVYLENAQRGASKEKLTMDLRAIRTAADIFTGKYPYISEDLRRSFINEKPRILVNMIPQLAALPQRQVITPCGISELATNRSPWTFADVISTSFSSTNKSKSGEKTLNCTCPSCGRKVEAVISSDTITCPECHASAPYKC